MGQALSHPSEKSWLGLLVKIMTDTEGCPVMTSRTGSGKHVWMELDRLNCPQGKA